MSHQGLNGLSAMHNYGQDGEPLHVVPALPKLKYHTLAGLALPVAAVLSS